MAVAQEKLTAVVMKRRKWVKTSGTFLGILGVHQGVGVFGPQPNGAGALVRRVVQPCGA